ncbi:putative disease resistance protein RGA3 [Cocos nucifera]|nr:putative disease resistance protein RGA3 [Cocos nucifera]
MRMEDIGSQIFDELASRFLDSMLKQSKSLRVLDLSGSQVALNSLPDAICGLSHLRYFDVSGTKIKRLPKSFCGLCHLQVLSMRSCPIGLLPEGMSRLINLRHLYGDACKISLITGIGDLTNLQELEEFRITNMGRHGIGELKGLRNLRGRLSILYLENINSEEEATEAMLKDKATLHLENTSRATSLHAEEIFEGLQPHPNLEELKIEGYGGIRWWKISFSPI